MKFTYLTSPDALLEWARKLVTDLTSFTNGVNSVPTGAQLGWNSAVAPVGWVLCDGASYTTVKYPTLFGVIAYTYGGSGANFNVPTNTSGFTNSIIKA